MRRLLRARAFVFIIPMIAIGLALAGAGIVLGSTKAQLPPSFADLVAKVSPAVVNIRTVKTIKGPAMPGMFRFGTPGKGQMPDLYEFFRRFFGGPGFMPPRQFKQRALGSGVIVDPEGYILTNNHVVAGADKIVVKLKNGRELPAKIVGRDKKTDLALLKIPAKHKLPWLPLGDSDKMRVGDWVIAVGNPFGLENTVTAGIISAKGRIIGAGPYDDFIQTDASINPGNSGGPLVNMKGEVIGINTAIVAHGQGIGFAIPSNMAKEIMAQLKAHGRVIRGWLGILIQPVTPDIAKSMGLKEAKGALVADVMKHSPADKAGLKRGDVIVEFNGKPVNDWHELPRMVAATKPGTTAKLLVIRHGHTRPVKVTVGELKETGGKLAKAAPSKTIEATLGMSVQKLTPELAKSLGLEDAKGLVITAVEPGGPADEAGLRRGDVILEAAQKPVNSVAQLKALASKLHPGQGLLLLIRRGGTTLFVVVKAREAK